jgi:uncharacterized membrane protein
MYIAIIAFLSIITILLLLTLIYCVCKISQENSKTEIEIDYSASDVELAHTTGWSGENF